MSDFKKKYKKPSLTKKEYSSDVNVNTIVGRMRRGIMPNMQGLQQTIQDFSEVGSFHQCLEKIRYANDAFRTLPAKVRHRFSNDPQGLIEFMQDEKNLPEAIELGLVKKPEGYQEKEKFKEAVKEPPKEPESPPKAG